MTLPLHALHALQAVALALLLAAPASAQIAPPGPNDPDMTLDARTKSAVIDSLAYQLRHVYVFPDVAERIAKSIEKRRAAHEYDRITSAKEFADSLTAHLQSVNHDLHLRAGYRHEPIPANDGDGAPPPAEIQREHEADRLRNFGFEQLRRLPGNIGYLDLRAFSSDPDAQPVAVAAMNWLANTDALIIDLRRNGGGDPVLLNTLITYLTKPGERRLINTFYMRQDDRTEQFYTAPYVPGPRYLGRPVYVLTSHRTGSCAEEFSYDVQTMKLGTLCGQTTAGAAHPGGFVRLNEHFAAFIAMGRPINPVTKKDWEGVGVVPDADVPAADALREAQVRLLGILKDKAAATDPDRAAALTRAIDDAKKLASEDPDDFERRRPPAKH